MAQKRYALIPNQVFNDEDPKGQKELTPKNVVSNKALHIFNTPITTVELSKLPKIKSILEKYPVKGATLGDIALLVQLEKALDGDTRAFEAYTKVSNMGRGEEETSKSNKDILGKMVEMLYEATKKAKSVEVIDAEANDTEVHTLEIDYEGGVKDE